VRGGLGGTHGITSRSAPDILVVLEDVPFIDAPDHHMVERAGSVQSGMARHMKTYLTSGAGVKGNATFATTSPPAYSGATPREAWHLVRSA
jgi:hypothetical protein